MKVTPKEYKELGTEWQNDSEIKCCTNNPTDTVPGCDCCYNNWTDELKKVKQEYSKVSENANQLNEQFKFVSAERDKLKVWYDDLDKTDLLVKDLCNQFKVMAAQADKICINTDKSVESIEILFCMIRDLYEQVDQIVILWNDIDSCIKCLNNENLPADSGILKCLKDYYTKVDVVLKTKTEVIKAIMTAIKTSKLLNAGICSEDFGLESIISEWETILNCDGDCGTASGTGSSCDKTTTNGKCELLPILTLPVYNDPYYLWVKDKYEKDKSEATTLSNKLLEANKKKEALSACQTSLITAIKEVDPKELCK